MKDVHGLALQVASNLVSVGASLGHVHVPGRPPADVEDEAKLETGEIEIGMGIHNEPGSQRVKTDLPGLVKIMLAQLLDQKDEDRAFLQIDAQKDAVVLLVNNLGGVSMLEMGGSTTEVVRQLQRDWHITPVRIYSGTYMTSLDGSGFSITLLRLQDTELWSGKTILNLLDAPVRALGWSGSLPSEVWTEQWEDVGHHTSGKEYELDNSSLRSMLTKVYHLELDANIC